MAPSPAVLTDREIGEGQETTTMRPRVLALGNALLDVIVRVEDEAIFNNELIDHFHLNPHVAQEAEAQVLANIIHTSKTRLGSEAIAMSAGGCAQNTCRILRWMDSNLRVCMVGSVGDDEEGDVLKAKVEDDGVICKFVRRESTCTGRTVALVICDERTFITHLGAASHFDVLDLKELDVGLATDTLVYVESYFAVHSFDVALKMALECNERPEASFAFNLCGEYVFQQANFVSDISQQLLPHIDVLFGNQAELEAFARRVERPQALGRAIIEALNDPTIEVVDASNVNEEEEEEEKDKGKMVQVVVTSGPDPITVFELHAPTSVQPVVRRLQRIRVPPVFDLVDSIGAGDAFVAGFLSGRHVHKWAVQKCVHLGIHVAQSILRQPGTRLPEHPFKALQ